MAEIVWLAQFADAFRQSRDKLIEIYQVRLGLGHRATPATAPSLDVMLLRSNSCFLTVQLDLEGVFGMQLIDLYLRALCDAAHKALLLNV